MQASPSLTIRRHYPRPDAALVAAFRDVPTGFVADAQGRRGALRHCIRPLTSVRTFVGPALPVATRSCDNLAPWAALEHARAGDVLAVATGGTEDASIIGDLMVGMARNCGIAAIVTDGLVRDLYGIERTGIPVFGCGVSPNSPFKDGPGEIGLTVTLGGVVIRAGDILAGDADGVVVVRQERIAEVLAALEDVKAKEAATESEVLAGLCRPHWLPMTLSAKGVRYID